MHHNQEDHNHHITQCLKGKKVQFLWQTSSKLRYIKQSFIQQGRKLILASFFSSSKFANFDQSRPVAATINTILDSCRIANQSKRFLKAAFSMIWAFFGDWQLCPIDNESESRYFKYFKNHKDFFWWEENNNNGSLGN